MSALMGTSVAELVTLLQKRDGRLPFEIGAFIALETCEKVLEGPAIVKADEVRIGDDGSITVYAPPHSAGSGESARSVVQVLARLLVAAGSGVPPVLLQLVEQGPSDGRWDLRRLRDELEASLVPLNRAAARRVLSRLVREAKRPPRKSSRPPPGGDPLDFLDADLDAFLDGAEPDADELPTSQLPALDAQGNPVVPFEEVTAKRDVRAVREAPPAKGPSASPPAKKPSEPPDRPSGRPTPVSEPAPRVRAPKPAPVPKEGRPPRADPTPLAPVRETSRPRPRPPVGLPSSSAPPAAGPDLDGFEEIDAGGGKRGMGFAVLGVLLVIGLGAAAVAVFRPDVIDRLTGNAPVVDEAAEEAERQRQRAEERAAAEAELRARYGSLSVRVPEASRAQIFLFIGRGPATAENLPAGVAHEFVAVADGRAPTRAVVPADATWTPTDDGLLYELGMQTGEDEMAFDRLVLGESRLERDAMGTPTGELGRVRVITTPPGARVFQLIGFGSARVEDLSTDAPVELLVYVEGEPPRRVFVGPSDWREGEDGKKQAEVLVEDLAG